MRVAGRPQPIPRPVIEALKAILTLSRDSTSYRTAQRRPSGQGAAVEVLEGPLAGLKGCFRRPPGTRRALILLHILGQPSLVKLDRNAPQAL